MSKQFLNAAEIVFLSELVKSWREKGKTRISFADIKGPLIEMKAINGGIDRKPTTVWSCLKRRPEADLLTFGSGQKRPGKAKSEEVPSGGAPTEEVSKIVASFTAKMERAVKKAAGNGQLKVAQKKIGELEKEVKLLKKKLLVLRRVAKISCRIRQEALTLTKVIEEIKKRDGIDIHALILED